MFKNNVIKFSEWEDLDDRFYDENIFQKFLCIERKRSERSGRPFLLMLIDIKRVVDSDKGRDAFKKIVSQLNMHARETDIIGWHSYKSVIGIIFTEVGEKDKNFKMRQITQRIQNSLFYVVESQYFHKTNLSMRWFPDDGNQEDRTYEPNPLFYPDIKKSVHKVVSFYLKRAIDIIGSIVGLVIFSPLFLVIPLLIKLTSRGPVFFRQERLGQFGRKFTFLKFRSMSIDNDDNIHREYIKDLIGQEINSREDGDESDQKSVYKIENDPRVTLIGNFLRKSSLDELPQFINVLKGEMSLVGPRPPIPYEYDDYKLWHMKRVIEVKPGITGLWQVEGRSSTAFDEMVRLDLKYIREWSILLDIKIILKTPWVVLTGKGAY
jgi:exopolysaccharide biosynthesis polyprenyl glycosylphosphotransferase